MSTPDLSVTEVAGVAEVAEVEDNNKNLQYAKDLHHHPNSPSQLLKIMNSKKGDSGNMTNDHQSRERKQ